MTRPIATRSSREKNTEQTKGHLRERPHRLALSGPQADILSLQNAAGNQAVENLLHSGPVQAKLKVSEPGDKYEQEADRVAETVMETTDHTSLQNLDGVDKEKGIPALPIRERAAVLSSSHADDVPDSVSKAIESTPGYPLDASTRTLMESRFGGHDFSQVRVHTSGQATEAAQTIQAKAFTLGSDIVFGAEQYAPGTVKGMQLLAHELTHVVQQAGDGSSNSTIQRGMDRQSPDTREIRWARAHPEGRVETLAPDHYILWNFSVGEASLKPEFKETLDRIGQQWPIFNLAGSGRFVIEGHTSSSGREKQNRRLSWRRALAVKRYLKGLDAAIPRNRMDIKAFGASRPRFPNISPSAMARNRRVEIKVLKPYRPDAPPSVDKPEPTQETQQPKTKRVPVQWIERTQEFHGERVGQPYTVRTKIVIHEVYKDVPEDYVELDRSVELLKHIKLPLGDVMYVKRYRVLIGPSDKVHESVSFLQKIADAARIASEIYLGNLATEATVTYDSWDQYNPKEEDRDKDDPLEEFRP